MLDPETVKKRGSSMDTITVGSQISFYTCREQVRELIQKEQNVLIAQKQYEMANYEQLVLNAINEYISKSPVVAGYVDSEGKPEPGRLKESLKSYYLAYDVIDPFIKDDDVSEIKILDYNSILITENGARYFAKDQNRRHIGFKSLEEYEHFITNLLLQSNKKLDSDKQYIDAITKEGYRVHVIGPKANAKDKNYSDSHDIIVTTIRKQRGSNYKIKEDVTGVMKIMGGGMGKLMEVIAHGWLSTIIFGETGAGKSVLMQTIKDNCEPTTAIYSAGNPSELRGRVRNEFGEVISNEINVEIREWILDSPPPVGYGTADDVARSNLRATPDIILTEEARSSSDFERMVLSGLMGHCEWATAHSDSVSGGVARINLECCRQFQNVSPEIVMDMVGQFLKFIIVNRKYNDGTLRIAQIAEIDGVKKENGVISLNVRMLYEFRREDTDEKSNNIHRIVKGRHYRVGNISENLQNRLYEKGFTKDMIEFLTKPLMKDSHGNLIPEVDSYEYEPLFEEVWE